MTATNLFGGSIDGDDVEAALLLFLSEWLPTYIPEIVRQKDFDHTRWPKGLQAIKTYAVKHAAAERWPDDLLPMLLAHCPSDGGKPEYHGDGRVDASFALFLSAIVSDADEHHSKSIARAYASAANMALNQHPSLVCPSMPDGFAEGIEWIGFRSMSISRGAEAERSLMAHGNVYVVRVANVLNFTEGPDAPLEDPDTDPGVRPTVKEGGASLRVEAGEDKVALLREGGFFPDE